MEKANQVHEWSNERLPAISHLQRDSHMQRHACDARSLTRTSGKCDSRERRGTRYDGAAQDGRSGELRLPGECAGRIARPGGKEITKKRLRKEGLAVNGLLRTTSPGNHEEKGDTEKVAR